ncbi:hypothetical protein BKA80DRAFT_266757 [Phyllosticta citrichinensis]
MIRCHFSLLMMCSWLPTRLSTSSRWSWIPRWSWIQQVDGGPTISKLKRNPQDTRNPVMKTTCHSSKAGICIRWSQETRKRLAHQINTAACPLCSP